MSTSIDARRGRFSLRSLMVLLVLSACGVWLFRNASPWQLDLKLSGHVDAISDSSFSPSGLRILTASWDGTARIWDAMDGKCLVVHDLGDKGLVRAAFSSDGTEIVTGGWSGVALWSAKKTGVGKRIYEYSVNLRSISLTEGDAKIVAVGTTGGRFVWDAETGAQVERQPGEGARLDDLGKGESRHLVRPEATTSPSGERVAEVSSRMDTVSILDAESGRTLAKLPAYRGQITNVTFSPDGRRLLISGTGKTACVWLRKHDESDYGVLSLHEFWLTIVLGVLLIWSLWRDRKHFKSLAPKKATESA